MLIDPVTMVTIITLIVNDHIPIIRTVKIAIITSTEMESMTITMAVNTGQVVVRVITGVVVKTIMITRLLSILYHMTILNIVVTIIF